MHGILFGLNVSMPILLISRTEGFKSLAYILSFFRHNYHGRQLLSHDEGQSGQP